MLIYTQRGTLASSFQQKQASRWCCAPSDSGCGRPRPWPQQGRRRRQPGQRWWQRDVCGGESGKRWRQALNGGGGNIHKGRRQHAGWGRGGECNGMEGRRGGIRSLPKLVNCNNYLIVLTKNISILVHRKRTLVVSSSSPLWDSI
jgi:hypothetical protein